MRNALNQIGALARRDLIIEFSYHFQLVMGLVAIVISVLTFYFIGQLVGDAQQLAGYAGGYFEFALIGLVLMAYSQVTVTSFGRSIEAAQAVGTLEILLATGTPLATLMAGTLLVPLLLASIQVFAYVALGWILVGFTLPLEGLGIIAILLLLTLGTFAAVGIGSAAVIVLTKRGDPFSTLVLQATNLLAGAVFPVAVLPEWLQVASRAVPAFYGLRGIREIALAGGGLSDVAIDLVVLVGFNAVLLPLSLWALGRAIAIARVTGTLGNR
jgi:ABC-2 type transport system permease protein